MKNLNFNEHLPSQNMRLKLGLLLLSLSLLLFAFVNSCVGLKRRIAHIPDFTGIFPLLFNCFIISCGICVITYAHVYSQYTIANTVITKISDDDYVSIFEKIPLIMNKFRISFYQQSKTDS